MAKTSSAWRRILSLRKWLPVIALGAVSLFAGWLVFQIVTADTSLAQDPIPVVTTSATPAATIMSMQVVGDQLTTTNERMLEMVKWILSLVITVAALLVGYNWLQYTSKVADDRYTLDQHQQRLSEQFEEASSQWEKRLESVEAAIGTLTTRITDLESSQAQGVAHLRDRVNLEMDQVLRAYADNATYDEIASHFDVVGKPVGTPNTPGSRLRIVLICLQRYIQVDRWNLDDTNKLIAVKRFMEAARARRDQGLANPLDDGVDAFELELFNNEVLTFLRNSPDAIEYVGEWASLMEHFRDLSRREGADSESTS